MLHTHAANETGNQKFYGYIPELLHELSLVEGFDYQIHIAEGNTYGYKGPDGVWDGMLGELLKDVSIHLILWYFSRIIRK